MPMSVPVKPVRMNAEQKRAEVAARRISAAQASARPPPNGGSVDRGHDHLGRVAQVHRQVGHEGLTVHTDRGVAVLAGCGRHAPVLQVQAGAEAASRASEDDHLAFGVGGDGVQGVVQLGDQIEVEGVEPFRPVETDDA